MPENEPTTTEEADSLANGHLDPRTLRVSRDLLRLTRLIDQGEVGRDSYLVIEQQDRIEDLTKLLRDTRRERDAIRRRFNEVVDGLEHVRQREKELDEREAKLAPALHVIHGGTGEIEGCAACAELGDVISGLERTVRSQSSTITKLERDKEAEARSDPAWDTIEELYDYWREECKHKRARFTAGDFWQALPLLHAYGVEMCCTAIDGAAFDPFRTTMRNGKQQSHNWWEQVFRNNSKFMSYANRAPAGFITR